MKYIAVFALLVLLNGCASNPEETDFFYGGWVHPHKQPSDASVFR